MTRKALVHISSGLVDNVIEIEKDAVWPVPDGYQLIPETGDAVGVGPGDTWDGTEFVAPVIPVPSRLEILMSEGPATQVYDQATDALVDRPADDITADKTELLGLLQTKLADSEDLTWEQMNKMLALERES